MPFFFSLYSVERRSFHLPAIIPNVIASLFSILLWGLKENIHSFLAEHSYLLPTHQRSGQAWGKYNPHCWAEWLNKKEMIKFSMQNIHMCHISMGMLGHVGNKMCLHVSCHHLDIYSTQLSPFKFFLVVAE